MQIDLEILKTNGQQYIDQIVDAEKETEWNKLAELKFKDNSPAELEVMKTLWTHGFMRGAETATRISMELYDLINTKVNAAPEQ